MIVPVPVKQPWRIWVTKSYKSAKNTMLPKQNKANQTIGIFYGIYNKADSRFVPSQWETVLICNDVYHWLDASLESALYKMSDWLICIRLMMYISYIIYITHLDQQVIYWTSPMPLSTPMIIHPCTHCQTLAQCALLVQHSLVAIPLLGFDDENYIWLIWINDCIKCMDDCSINSLWSSDAIWQRFSLRSTLPQVMACCLTAPSHYLNQCWFITSGVLRHSTEINFATSAQDSNS